MTKPLPIGTTITDRDGYCGTITNITHFDGSHWYDVRFDRGSAVHFDSDIAHIDITGKATSKQMTFIDENTDRATLEIAAIFDCDIDCAVVESATDEELRGMIIDWIQAGDECAAA